MITNRYKLIIGLCLFANILIAQAEIKKDTVKTYKVGEKLADDVVQELHPFLGKPIILDFWATWCASCISSFPELKKIQEKFNDQFQIVLVTNQNSETVEKFALQNEVYKNLGLPSLVGNQKLWNSFSFRTIPLHIWIDSNGYVKYITSGGNITSDRVAAFLKGDEFDLPDATSSIDFNRDAPLWLEGNGRQNKHLKYYSFIMDYLVDAGGSLFNIEKDKSTGIVNRVEGRNLTIDGLFALAHGKSTINNPFFMNNRKIINVSNKERFTIPIDLSKVDKWYRSNAYCYDIALYDSKSDEIFKFMQTDLERFFNLKTYVERREVPCLVLNSSDINLIKSKGEKPTIFLRTEDDKNISIRNRLMYILMQEMQFETESFSALPLVNETGFEGRVDIEFKRFPQSLQSLNEDLEKYGLYISQENREIDIMIIDE